MDNSDPVFLLPESQPHHSNDATKHASPDPVVASTFSPQRSPTLQPLPLSDSPHFISASIPPVLPVSAPSLSLAPGSASSTAPEVPAKKRQGRRHKFCELPEPQRKALYKAMRAAQNRMCARVSRAKKQKYVEDLEAEVKSLKNQLAECKMRLEKYEAIEKQLDPADLEDKVLFAETMKEASSMAGNSACFVELFMRKMEQKLANGRKAMEQLAHLMVQITVPLSMRTVLWSSQSKDNLYTPEGLIKLVGFQPNVEETKKMIESVMAMYPEAKHIAEMRTKRFEVLQQMRRDVKQMLRSQKEIQLNTLRFWRFVRENFAPGRVPGKQESCPFFKQKLLGRPELGDYEFFQLNDSDFGIEEDRQAKEEEKRDYK